MIKDLFDNLVTIITPKLSNYIAQEKCLTLISSNNFDDSTISLLNLSLISNVY